MSAEAHVICNCTGANHCGACGNPWPCPAVRNASTTPEPVETTRAD